MKKLFIISIILFVAVISYSQTAVTIPEIPLENKYALARSFMYNVGLTALNLAKEEGITAKEYGILCGDIYKAAWPEEKSFEEFSQDCIYHLVCLSGKKDSESPSIVLLNQSENKIVFEVSDLYPGLYEQGEMWGTSYKDMVKWWEATYNQIAGKYNLSFAIKTDENKVIVTINKN